MHKISLIVLLTAAVSVSGCYTKTYLRERAKAQQTLSSQTIRTKSRAKPTSKK